MENLENLKNLEILDLAYNRIPKIENIENLSKLTDLWLNHNKIADFKDFEILKYVPHVTTIYLWKNPIADPPSYKQRVMEYLKEDEQIDSFVVPKNKNKLNLY